VGYIKWFQSGTLLEKYEYAKNLPIRRKSSKTAVTGVRSRKVGLRNPDSLRRAQRGFRRLVRANLVGDVPPAFITLTMFQVLPLEASCVAFTQFIARLRREHGTDFRYIAVPEFQKRGAVHFHLLLWGLNEYAKTESETRYFARLWLRGFCDCLITDGSPRLAGYFAKYMSKSLQDVRLGGKKAYLSGRNTLRPVSISASTLAHYKLEVIAQEVIHTGELTFEKTFDSIWLGRCHYQKFHITKHESSTHQKGGDSVKEGELRDL